jgi:hypothetical protein
VISSLSLMPLLAQATVPATAPATLPVEAAGHGAETTVIVWGAYLVAAALFVLSSARC